ncbi:MAG: hypothetical protein V8S12_01990, partial [Lachnospiraceae bacterium]
KKPHEDFLNKERCYAGQSGKLPFKMAVNIRWEAPGFSRVQPVNQVNGHRGTSGVAVCGAGDFSPRAGGICFLNPMTSASDTKHQRTDDRKTGLAREPFLGGKQLRNRPS